MFLPQSSRLVQLYIQYLHTIHQHCGVATVISLYRQTLWSPKLSVLVRCLISRRVICCRARGMPYPLQPPPPLPAARVTYSRLFTNVGLDHTGHMVYRQSNAFIHVHGFPGDSSSISGRPDRRIRHPRYEQKGIVLRCTTTSLQR